MQVFINEKFIKNRQLLARVGTWGGLGVLLSGFIISLAAEQVAQFIPPSTIIIITWVTMVVGFTAFNIGRYNAVRWVNRPREDEVIALGLKGLDHRHKFLNYLPQTRAYHVLFGPSGVYVMHVRNQDGMIYNEGGTWRRRFSISTFLRTLFEGGFGNPTNDVTREAYSVGSHLAKVIPEEEASQVRLQPLIIFTDPRAKLALRDPAVPVLTPKELKSYMRRQAKEVRLNADQMDKIAEAFGVA